MHDARLVVVAAGRQGGDLSILYLRCVDIIQMAAVATARNTFNSLFEMHVAESILDSFNESIVFQFSI